MPTVPVTQSVSSTTGQKLPIEPGCAQDASDGVVRPASLVLACADYNLRVEHATWTAWTTDEASGTGTFVADDCVPSCAEGHFHSQRAELVLFAPKTFDGRLVFSRLRVHLDGPLAPFDSNTYTFSLVP